MRFKALLALGVLSAPLLRGQGVWEDFLRHRSKFFDTPRWSLVLDPAAREAFFPNPPSLFARLAVAEELQILPPKAGLAAQLWEAKALPADQHWFLISPEGELVPGKGLVPNPEEFLDLLKSRGFVPRWERREAFLREHPEQAEARLEALRDAVLLANLHRNQKSGLKPGTSIPDTEAGRALADELARFYEVELEAFLQVPDPDHGPINMVVRLFGALSNAGWHLSPRMEALRSRFIRHCLDRLEQSGNPKLAFGLAEGGPQAQRALLSLLQGRTSPFDLELADTVLMALHRQPPVLPPGELLVELGRIAFPNPDPSAHPPLPILQPGARVRLTLLLLHLRSLLQLEQWERVADLLPSLRGFPGYRGAAADIREQLKQENLDLPDRSEIRRALTLPPPPALTVRLEAPPPLRLCLLGDAPWAEQWATLKVAPEFQPWALSELRWERRPAPVVEPLRQRKGWPPGPRWALISQDEVLHSDTVCPTPKQLANLVKTHAPAALHTLSDHLDRHPGCPGALSLRQSLLHDRMPAPHLEAQLVADSEALEALAVLTPVEGWTPDPALWEGPAIRILPRLEMALKRWPSNPALWSAWVHWAALHPRRPSVQALMEQVPFWQKAADWPSQLPLPVHQAVAEALRKGKRYEEMRRWFQRGWDSLVQDGTGFLEAMIAQGGAKTLGELEQGLINPLKESLRALNREAELRALERRWAELTRKEGK